VQTEMHVQPGETSNKRCYSTEGLVPISSTQIGELAGSRGSIVAILSEWGPGPFMICGLSCQLRDELAWRRLAPGLGKCSVEPLQSVTIVTFQTSRKKGIQSNSRGRCPRRTRLGRRWSAKAPHKPEFWRSGSPESDVARAGSITGIESIRLAAIAAVPGAAVNVHGQMV